MTAGAPGGSALAPPWHTPERDELGQAARAFARRLRPVADELDPLRADIPTGVLREMADLGVAADFTVEDTTRYLTRRAQFGRPLSEFQALRFQLAELAARVDAAHAHYRQVRS
jgi:hypothetical protein